MKLLLTSAGITNNSIGRILKKWIKGKIKIAFIPTAANMQVGEKDWLIEDLVNCAKLGTVDIIDIMALDRKEYMRRLSACNVIAMGGGNTSYLMKCIAKTKFKNDLKKLLKTKVYVGISAGSIAAAKKIYAASEFLYGDEMRKAPDGLGLIDFNVRSHLNSKHFPKVRDKYLKEIKIRGDLYALDDDSALAFDNGKISVVSEGEWKFYKESK